MTIKFVRIGDQLDPGKDQFSFFNTDLKMIICFDFISVFDNWNQFCQCYDKYKKDIYNCSFSRQSPLGEWIDDQPLSFFKSLMPKDMLPKEEGKSQEITQGEFLTNHSVLYACPNCHRVVDDLIYKNERSFEKRCKYCKD